MSTHNLCFKQKYEKYRSFFLSENFQFLEIKCFIYLNRRVFVMITKAAPKKNTPSGLMRKACTLALAAQGFPCRLTEV